MSQKVLYRNTIVACWVFLLGYFPTFRWKEYSENWTGSQSWVNSGWDFFSFLGDQDEVSFRACLNRPSKLYKWNCPSLTMNPSAAMSRSDLFSLDPLLITVKPFWCIRLARYFGWHIDHTTKRYEIKAWAWYTINFFGIFATLLKALAIHHLNTYLAPRLREFYITFLLSIDDLFNWTICIAAEDLLTWNFSSFNLWNMQVCRSRRCSEILSYSKTIMVCFVSFSEM